MYFIILDYIDLNIENKLLELLFKIKLNTYLFVFYSVKKRNGKKLYGDQVSSRV